MKPRVYNALILLAYFVYEPIEVSEAHKVMQVFHMSSTLEMDGVHLKNNQEYLRLQENNKDSLECRFTVDPNEGETVEYVTWYHDDHLAMKWSSKEPPSIGKGVEEGDLMLTRNDWHLHFAKLNPDLAGIYRCEVTTSKGETMRSRTYQLIIVDMPYIHSDLAEYTVEDCKIKFSFRAPAVNPKPEPLCGIWSVKHSYLSIAPSFMGTPYFNGSIGYSLIDEIFEIYGMPFDAVIRCELKVTKIDTSVIQLLEKSYGIPEVAERGCPPVEVGEGIALKYENYRLTCRNEVIALDSSKPVTLNVSCQEGYTPQHPDYVTSVMLDCSENAWKMSAGFDWNHFDNLLCVLPENAPRAPKLETKENTMNKDQEITSGGQSLMSPWLILLFAGVTVASGIIWGLKLTVKKKDPRYMA